MPALGYIPQGQFAFPRSYCQGIQIRHDLMPPAWAGNGVDFWIAGPPDALCQVHFKTNFFAWSSNRYTLDYVVESAYYRYPPAPAIFDLPYYLVWVTPDDFHAPAILFDVTYGGTYTTHALPAAPGGWWQPERLP